MHTDWQLLIPFYLTGKISDTERRSLEAHLADCQLCRQRLDEWKAIENAVEAHMSSSSRELPPLTMRLELAKPHVYSNGYSTQKLSRANQPSRKQTSSSLLPIVLAGIASILLAITGLILYLLIAANSKFDTASDITVETILVTSSFTPTWTPTYAPAEDRGIMVITLTPTPQDVHTSTPIPVPASTELSPVMQYPCLLGNTSGQGINLYSGPDTRFVVLTEVVQFNNTTVLYQTAVNWYQVRYVEDAAIWMGWVNGDEVNMFGSCHNLPVIEIPD